MSSSSAATSTSTGKKKITINFFYDKNLLKVLQQGWSEERLIKGQIATLTGRTFKITISDHKTIKKLKHKIEDQEGYEVEKQQLRKGSKNILHDEKTIADYKVTNGMTLLLLVESEPNDYPRERDDKPKKISTKTRRAPPVTQTLTITAEEAKKMGPQLDNWWEGKYTNSGPLGRKTPTSAGGSTTPKGSAAVNPFDQALAGGSGNAQKTTTIASSSSSAASSSASVVPSSPVPPSPSLSSPLSAGVILGGGGSSTSSQAPQSAEARRELLRKASEARLKKQQQ